MRLRSAVYTFVLLAQAVLLHNKPKSHENASCLFALTGQSNISNSKNPLSMIEFASSMGYHTLLDAAALAPSSSICLSDHPQLDAMAVSFYKMFGFPTGVGALIVKKSFLAQLKRPWFSGGNVDVVQVPGTLVTRSHDIHEQFEVYFFRLFFIMSYVSPSVYGYRTARLII
jgi:selenocysteine lyase/cysteine desulfurase